MMLTVPLALMLTLTGSLSELPASAPVMAAPLVFNATAASAPVAAMPAVVTAIPAQDLAPVQELHRGNGGDPATLDPHRADDVGTANVLRDLYQGLTDEAPNGDVIPGAAESWEISDDGKTYVFHLRANGRWSNGDAVTAENFASSLRRSANPATGSNYSQVLSPIENAEAVTASKLSPDALGVEAVDDHTLIIRLKAPTTYFLSLLAHSCTYPVHQGSLKKFGKLAFRAENFVGNGAYRLVEWKLQSHVLLERNPNYWDNAHTTIERVYYHAIEDASSEFKRYRAGEIDWSEGVPLTQLKWIKQNIPQEFRTSPYLGIYYYGFNLTQPPFKDNLKLRRALTMAIDRDIIVKKVLGTNQQPAYSWVPPVTHYAQQIPEWSQWPRAQQMAEARKLYAEAGYSADHPLQLELRYNTSEDHKKIAVVIAAMWKQYLGVETKLINEEFKVFLKNRTLKKVTQVFRSGWIGDYNDAFTFSELMHSRNGNNDDGYANPQYDSLLEQASLQSNADQRQLLLQEAERLMLNDAPVLPLYFYVSKRLVKPWVVGWQGNIMDHHATKDLKILKH